MSSNHPNEDKSFMPAVNAYFADSGNDVFDEISCGKTSVESENVVAIPESSSVEVQPVVCRIFSSESEISEKTPDKVFFDTLGRESNKIVANPPLALVSPEFPSEGSFLSPASSTDSDAVTDELFMRGQNAFPAGNSGESDRRRDAWIPCERTRQALIAAATTASYTPSKELLTMPGVIMQTDLTDNIHQGVSHYLGEVEAAERKVLTMNDVTQDERGLRELIQAECYRAGVNLTSRLLTMYGQGSGRVGTQSKHTLHSIQLWFTRIALLMKLRQWQMAWAESEAWWDFDRPDLYFQFYSELYGGRPGTFVPFSFRLLLAELPQYVGKAREAFKRLFHILNVVRKILKNLAGGFSEDGSHVEITPEDREESTKLWSSREIRVMFSIFNLFTRQKDYKLAVDTLESIIDHPRQEKYRKRALVSAMGRIYLQMGDLTAAKAWFDRSKSLKNEGTSCDVQELTDHGMLELAGNNYEKSFEYFHKASLKDPTNVMVINNKAVCLLYQGKQREAVNLLEAAVGANPTASLHENLLLNVCTMYELESSVSLQNKHKMLKLVAKYKGDFMQLNCLKLQTMTTTTAKE